MQNLYTPILLFQPLSSSKLLLLPSTKTSPLSLIPSLRQPTLPSCVLSLAHLTCSSHLLVYVYVPHLGRVSKLVQAIQTARLTYGVVCVMVTEKGPVAEETEPEEQVQ